MLSAAEASAVVDRAFEVRCAAEDIATAIAEGASGGELRELVDSLVSLAREAERLR